MEETDTESDNTKFKKVCRFCVQWLLPQIQFIIILLITLGIVKLIAGQLHAHSHDVSKPGVTQEKN